MIQPLLKVNGLSCAVTLLLLGLGTVSCSTEDTPPEIKVEDNILDIEAYYKLPSQEWDNLQIEPQHYVYSLELANVDNYRMVAGLVHEHTMGPYIMVPTGVEETTLEIVLELKGSDNTEDKISYIRNNQLIETGLPKHGTQKIYDDFMVITAPENPGEAYIIKLAAVKDWQNLIHHIQIHTRHKPWFFWQEGVWDYEVGPREVAYCIAPGTWVNGTTDFPIKSCLFQYDWSPWPEDNPNRRE